MPRPVRLGSDRPPPMASLATPSHHRRSNSCPQLYRAAFWRCSRYRYGFPFEVSIQMPPVATQRLRVSPPTVRATPKNANASHHLASRRSPLPTLQAHGRLGLADWTNLSGRGGSGGPCGPRGLTGFCRRVLCASGVCGSRKHGLYDPGDCTCSKLPICTFRTLRSGGNLRSRGEEENRPSSL